MNKTDYPPPQLAQDGYRIINAAWTPLYIAGGSGQQPDLIYKWNPWLLGEFPGHVSWWSIPQSMQSKVVGVKMVSPRARACGAWNLELLTTHDFEWSEPAPGHAFLSALLARGRLGPWI